jgi:hypothetical protein
MLKPHSKVISKLIATPLLRKRAMKISEGLEKDKHSEEATIQKKLDRCGFTLSGGDMAIFGASITTTLLMISDSLCSQ